MHMYSKLVAPDAGCAGPQTPEKKKPSIPLDHECSTQMLIKCSVYRV